MGACRACKRNLGLFNSGKRACSEMGCEVSDCTHCHRLLHECKECGDLFCDQHMSHKHDAPEDNTWGSDDLNKPFDESLEKDAAPKKSFKMYGEYGLLNVSENIDDDMNNLDMLNREHGYVLVGQTEEYFIVHKGGKQ